MELTTPKQQVDWKSYKLTSRQAKFVNLLVSDPTTKHFKAYKLIFLTKSDSSARSGASKLMAQSNIQAYKSALEAMSANKAIKDNSITVARVLKEESCIAFFEIGALVDEDGFFIQNLKELPEEVRRNISGLEITEKVDPHSGNTVPYYKLKFNDKGRSLQRLEQHLGMLKDRIEIGVDVTIKGLIAQIDGKQTGAPMIPHLKGDE